MSNPCMDQQSDVSGRETHRLLSLHPFPASISKSASETLPVTFADPIGHRWPTDDAGSVWTSLLFFLDKRAAIDSATAEIVDNNLDYYADYFGIKDHTDELRTKFAKSAGVPDTVFALHHFDEDGVLRKNWPMRNAAEVKMASSYLLKYRDKIDYNTRKEAAARILRAADDYQVVPDEHASLLKIAGIGTCDKATIVSAITKRSAHIVTSHPNEAQQLLSVAEEVMRTPASASAPENLVKLAETLDMVDDGTGLRAKNAVAFPEDDLFSVSVSDLDLVKSAYVQLPQGDVYTKADLERIPPDVLQDWFGDAFAKKATIGGLFTVDADQLSKLIGELSPNHQEQFAKMAKSLNIVPAASLSDEKPADMPMSRDKLVSLLDD